jgi:hypothetical protein
VASKAPPSQPSSDRPLVYSLFGRGDHSESLVLTDKNLLEYLINLTKELPPLPDTVRASLRAPSTGFLFVGFGFSNWWLRLLLKVLHITGVDNRLVSLAFEDGDSFAAAVRLENQGFFDSAGIYIQSGDWAALSRELAERYRNSAPPRIQRSELPLGRTGDERQPLVFLSYASEDRDTVNRIRDGLEARGVSVWQDVQNLRGGQNWEAKIEEFIKRVDYFVFVQTENMDRRDEGEYNYELTLALRRAKKKAFGSVFLLHVAIGNCRARPEPELAAIHRIQLDLDKGVDALADPILGAFAANSTPAPASRAV